MILTLDTAFRSLGWAVLDKGTLVAWGTITTKKDPRKHVKVADDYAARCASLSSELISIIKKHRPQGILGELPHGSQNAIAAKLLGGAVATVTAIATGYNLPLEWISEGDSKKAALGQRSGTKEDAMTWARQAYPATDFGKIKCRLEHVADALMAYNGLKNGILVRTFG